MNVKELTPEQKARQTLMLDAIREQAAYERSKRRKIAKAAKDVGKTFIALLTLTMVSMMLFSCDKEELEVPCTTYTIYNLGLVGEEYTPVPSNGVPGRIYVEGNMIKQKVCGNECIYTKLIIEGDNYEWICLP